MAAHVAEQTLLGSIESSLRQAAAAGIVADADFATDQATTLANIASRNTNIHVSNRPLYEKAVWAVKKGFENLGSTVMITDLATIYAAVDGTWQPGFQV